RVDIMGRKNEIVFQKNRGFGVKHLEYMVFCTLEIERDAEIIGGRKDDTGRDVVAEELFATDDVLFSRAALLPERIDTAVLKQRDRASVQLRIDLPNEGL